MCIRDRLMGTVPVSIGAERIMGNLYDKMFYKVAPAGKDVYKRQEFVK